MTSKGSATHRQGIAFSLVFVLLFLNFSNGLYFVVSPKISKCFTIEQPKDTPIVFAYEILDAGHKAKLTLHYGPTASSELLIMTRTFTKPIGHIDYITDNDGVYSICLDLPESDNPDSPPQSTRMKLSINYGYDAEYYEKLSKQKNFEVINLEVHKLNDMMIMTLNEADYQKHKEVDYHTLTERMNVAALWWPMVQIGILVVMGVAQVQHLKHFFKNHKVI